jgi:hypothetical protein
MTSKDYSVAVVINDKQIGEVVVVGDDDTEPIQAAAVAYEALRSDATFVVNGEAFTSKECDEWFA